MKKLVVINSEFFGRGSDELGKKLIGSFLRKVWSQDDKPDAVIFYNSAVKLLEKGSPVLDALDALAAAGVDLIACGTCVTHYELKSKLALGRVSDMQEISSSLMSAERVITV